MARHDILKNPIKLDSYNLVFKQLQQYEKSIQNGGQHFKEVDDLIEQLTPFRTKKGQLKKSGIRTNKGRAAFNKLIQEAKKEKLVKISYRKEIERRMKKGLKKYAKEQKHKESSIPVVADVIRSNTFDGIIPFSEYYELVFGAADEDIDSEDILDVFEQIKDRYELETPSSSKEPATKDARYQFLNDIFNRVDKLKESGNATTEDLLLIIQDAIQKLKENQ